VEYVLWMVKQRSHLYKKIYRIQYIYYSFHHSMVLTGFAQVSSRYIFFFLQELRLWLSLLVRCC
jgi:hypothetical protein